MSAQAIETDVGPIGDSSTTSSTGPAASSSSTTTTSPSTTSTTGSTTSTTAPALLPDAGGDSTTSTTRPPGSGGQQEPAPAAAGDGAPVEGAGPMPSELVAMMNSVRRTRANNTRQLLGALAPLGQYGLDPTGQAMIGFGRFPVGGESVWSDDWWLPRYGPGWRLHEGIDIFAAMGTPVRAPVDGRVRITNGGLGGLAVYVVQPNRTYWYLAHLSGLAPGIAEGVEVRTGDNVGFVGNSGNAMGGRAHLHFEIHPGGGPPIPPKPVIDRFVSDAAARVPALLDAYAKAYAAGSQAATQPQLALPDPDLASLTARDAMLWASAVNPASGTFHLVEMDARDALASVDWDAVAAARADAAMDRQRVRMWLLPLVPSRLARLL